MGLPASCLMQLDRFTAIPQTQTDSDNVYSTNIDTNTISGLQKNDQYTMTIYSSYTMSLMHVGRPPLG